eukprot:TRINITY_DN45646_c0_g1_i1.p1 TRINITY_DN45646_c0_g1~~TRINITY_DN45646_c0_g1_i1.p1  ORF type:complete len:143 (-),score=46.69 TRINITY_DN45646_c0_g1_i1:219-647(-)
MCIRDRWKVLRVSTIVACVLQVIISVLDIIDFNIPRMILSVYCIIFCILIVLAELGIELVLSRLNFLSRPRGRALFILFVGTMTFGQDKWLGYAAGGIMIADGCFTLVASCFDYEGGLLLGGGKDGGHSAIGDAPSAAPSYA